MSNMTPWFPPDIKPVRKGVYLVSFNSHDPMQKLYAAWNGKRWSNAGFDVNSYLHNRLIGASQNKYWRGFTEEQK